jgi:hypothetical protein
MTALATRTKYKLSLLQMAAEASLATEKGEIFSGAYLIAVVEEGNRRSSKFAASEAVSFDKYWKVVDHKADTDT